MNHSRDKLIETMARATRADLYDEIEGANGVLLDRLALLLAEHKALMDRALSALESSGMVVVPGWKPIDTAPKDGRTIAVQAVMHVHHLEGVRFDHMPRDWRPDTPDAAWRFTGWRDVETSSEQMVASSDRPEGKP